MLRHPRSFLLGLILGLALGLGSGCSKVDDLFGDSAEDDIDCYSSFDSFKNAMKREGKGLPPEQQWHHIVNQNPANKKRFGERLHCTDNLIALPRPVHQRVSAHYSTKPSWSKPRTVRAVVSERSWDEQYDYGVRLLREYGYEP